MGENTRLVYDVLHTTSEKQVPGIMLLKDFEKAFDTIFWRFVCQTLEFFNFWS